MKIYLTILEKKIRKFSDRSKIFFTNQLQIHKDPCPTVPFWPLQSFLAREFNAPRSKLQFCCQMELKHLRNYFCMNEIENLCAYLAIFLFHKMEPQNHKAYHIAGENYSCIFDCKIWCLGLQLVSVWFWRFLFGGSKILQLTAEKKTPFSVQLKVAFSQKGLMCLSFLQTGKPNYFPELKFWILFHSKWLKACQKWL